jgi:exonuclease VII large subunit
VLSHGYAMVQGEDGRIVSSVGDVRVGERVEIGLRDGKIIAAVEEMKENSTKEDR